MDYRPAYWTPQDVARIRGRGLFRNVKEEVARARVMHEFGPRVEALRKVFEPPRRLRIPEGLDPSAILDDVLRVYELATTPVAFGEKMEGSPEGSNNGAVSPSRTATRTPDPG